jgi:hypothetical protein
MYKTQADEIKDWLRAYVNNEKEIDELLEKIRELRGRATSIGAQEITDMPKAPINITDSMAEYMVRLDSMERQVQDMIRAHKSSKKALEEVLDKMESLKQKKIIRCRYIYGMEWSDVIYQCYHEKPDYQMKLRAYSKRVYRDHDRALLEMARKWTEK